MRLFDRVVLTLGAMLVPLSMAHAGLVDYATTPLGGNLWRYDYTINNTTPSTAFDELTVFFDVNSYELLSAPTAPAGWDPIVVQPDTGIPASGFFDVLSLGGFLADGQVLTGFSLTFAYLGPGTPGEQRFDLLNSADFSVTLSGTTTQPGAVPIPEPGTALLVLSGLATVLSRRAKRVFV